NTSTPNVVILKGELDITSCNQDAGLEENVAAKVEAYATLNGKGPNERCCSSNYLFASVVNTVVVGIVDDGLAKVPHVVTVGINVPDKRVSLQLSPGGRCCPEYYRLAFVIATVVVAVIDNGLAKVPHVVTVGINVPDKRVSLQSQSHCWKTRQ